MSPDESPVPPRPLAPSAEPSPVVRPPRAGETMRVLADVGIFRLNGEETGGAFSLVELLTPPGGGVAPHAHPDADEILYVVRGTYRARIADLRDTLRAGACAFVPRGAVHAFENVHDETACLLVLSTPAASPERLFVELATGFATATDQSPAFVQVFRSIAATRGVSIEEARPAPRPRLVLAKED